MSMVIKDNSELFSTLGIYNKNADAMHKSILRIASGMKINSAADDPSGLSITDRMRERIRSLDQANQNAQNDNSLMRTAEGALNNTVDILKTLRERAINSANDANTDQERAIIQKEVQQFLWQIDNNATTTTFNGQKLLDGTWEEEGLNFHIGGEANFAVTLKMQNMTVSALGLSELDLSTREGAMKALGVYDEEQGKYVNYITVTDEETGEEVRQYGLLDTALNKVLDQLGSIGAMEERLGFTRDILTETSGNLQAAEAGILDSDVAAEMTNFVKYNILNQAAQYMLAQQNQISATVVDLLKPTV